jgi:pachytene checkpoint protein 2
MAAMAKEIAFNGKLGDSPEGTASPQRRGQELPKGFADVRALPDEEFLRLWHSIVVAPSLKDQLLSQAIFNFTARPKVGREVLPLHGSILLVGPPGTGKTSLAKGLAARCAETFDRDAAFQYVEIDPHALTSSSLGKSQRSVNDLFGESIAEYAAIGPTVVLLDEVESLLVDRAQLSLEANPIDVHRATDAALVQLDQLADKHPNLLFVATSNFPEAIDAAFISRVDLVLNVPKPDEAGRKAILVDTLKGLGEVYPAVAKLAACPSLGDVVRASEGLDGRRMRKLVAAGCTQDKQTALNPGDLTIEDLVAAATAMRQESAFGLGRRE